MGTGPSPDGHGDGTVIPRPVAGVQPAAVIGSPGGFVGAAESTQALAGNDLGLEYLVVHGRRGGSALTVAAVNAIASTDELTNTSRQA